MTTKNSICVRCKHLDEYGTCIPDKTKEITLISFCNLNARGSNGCNRRQCRNFEKATDEIIQTRVQMFERDEKKGVNE